MVGRLLGKMAIEIICQSDPNEARHPRYDKLRRYVRYGVTEELWVLAYHYKGDWRQVIKLREKDGELFENVICYSYTLYQVQEGQIFTFDFGGDSWAISMNNWMPSQEMKDYLASERYQPIWYSRSEWSRD